MKPKIASFTPTQATGLTNVTITGSGLGSVSEVDFNGVASPSVDVAHSTATKVIAQVPVDTTKGPIVVKVSTGAPDSPPSATLFVPLPKITSLDAYDGKAGQTVRILGSNLTGGTAPTVKFGTISVTPLSVTATEVDAAVPGAPFSTGSVSVTTGTGTALSPHPFAITKVTGMTPASAVAGTAVTITGQGLGSTTAVDFGGHAGVTPVGTPTATAVKVLVPSDAVSGPLSVHTPNIDVAGIASAATFKPLPKITGFGTSPVQAGDLVAINGTNLMPTGTVPTAKLGTTAMSASAFNSQTSISVFVPDAGLTGRVTLTTPNGIATSPTNLAVRPKITAGPSLDTGVTGTTVQLQGLTFTGTTSVQFANGVSAAFTLTGALGSTQTLSFKVPATAATGPVTLRNAGGATASSGFTVSPTITSFTPASATAGATVTVSGSGFGLSGDPRTVTVGNVTASNVTWVSTNSLRFVVPDGAPVADKVHVQVNGGATAASPSNLSVTATIASFTPAHGPAGTDVEIDGAGFTGATAVKFNGVAASVTSNTGTVIHATVPAGTTPGKITITRGTAPTTLTSGTNFDNESAITAISAKDAQPGQTIVLTGTDLGSADLVTFSGTLDNTNAPVSADATSVHVVVPKGAEAGPITVHTALGDAQSADTLVIDPRVDSFNPTSGVAGTAVDITGAGLAGVTSVAFDGVPASIIVVHNAESISAQVPDGASTGVITVTWPADAGLGLAAFPADSADTFTFLYAHANGLGQSYTSTDAPSTFSASDAAAAAQAWDSGGTLTTGVFCNTSEAAVEMVNAANTQVAVWVYGAGTLQGHVYLNTANTTPLCPTASDPAWN